MKSRNPFSIILDRYEKECEELYDHLCRKMHYPHLSGKLSLVETKLKKAAFAYLCADYLAKVADEYQMDDFPLFLEQAGFLNQRDAVFYILGKENIKWQLSEDLEEDDLFSELVWELLQKYKKWWGNKIANLYVYKIEILELFDERIFKDSSPTGINAVGNALNFIEENF